MSFLGIPLSGAGAPAEGLERRQGVLLPGLRIEMNSKRGDRKLGSGLISRLEASDDALRGRADVRECFHELLKVVTCMCPFGAGAPAKSVRGWCSGEVVRGWCSGEV